MLVKKMAAKKQEENNIIEDIDPASEYENRDDEDGS
jgi:hypothetical protein